MTLLTTRPPIAIFAFNRPDHLRNMFASLRKCNGFADSFVTIFVDGPRRDSDREGVQAVRDFVSSLDLPNVRGVFRDANMGLKRSVFTGVSDLCREYGRVIVFEDDFLLSPVILDYFNEALDKYADNLGIWSIVGYMYDVPELKNLDRAVVLPFTHPWGWATWDRAWRNFELDRPVPEEQLKSIAFRERFNMNGICDYASMLELALQNKVNSWFIQWYYTIFMHQGLSIFPPSTLVKNDGVGDAKATHGSRFNPYNRIVKPSKPSERKPLLPETPKVAYGDIDKMVRSWDARIQRYIIFLGKLKRALKR